jgi:predicted nucleic acid-binding protein
MAWVVDSCMLLDVALKDPEWGFRSAEKLEALRSGGLVVCPVTVIEITPQFGGDIAEVRKFLAILGASERENWLDADTLVAAKAWSAYVTEKRKSGAGRVGKRPVADLMIGAFASRFDGLLTRNPDHFRPWFPKLKIPV